MRTNSAGVNVVLMLMAACMSCTDDSTPRGGTGGIGGSGLTGGAAGSAGGGSGGVADADAVDAAGAIDGGSTPAGELVITIQDLTYSPENLIVPPGSTVLVRNLDVEPHSVTSQSAVGDYRRGAVAGVTFDTGTFSGQRSFSLPQDAPSGTVIPYFCTVHLAGMRNQGRLTIR